MLNGRNHTHTHTTQPGHPFLTSTHTCTQELITSSVIICCQLLHLRPRNVVFSQCRPRERRNHISHVRDSMQQQQQPIESTTGVDASDDVLLTRSRDDQVTWRLLQRTAHHSRKPQRWQRMHQLPRYTDNSSQQKISNLSKAHVTRDSSDPAT